MQQRDERTMDAAIGAIILRVTDIKNSLQQLMLKMEQESDRSEWPSYLDSFSVISAQIVTLLKTIRNENTPFLRNYLTLPLQLNAEVDEQLVKLTEGRVPALSHDFVPNLLRTKPEPDVEQKQHTLDVKMAQVNTDTATKQINLHNKVVKHVIDILTTAKEEWDSETTSRSTLPQTCSLTETHLLIAALGTGKNLKPSPAAPPRGTAAPGPSPNSQPPTKAASSIKTNIKAATQMHPYQR